MNEIKNEIRQLVIDNPTKKQGIYLDSKHPISIKLNALEDDDYYKIISNLKEEDKISLVYGWLSEYCISW